MAAVSQVGTTARQRLEDLKQRQKEIQRLRAAAKAEVRAEDKRQKRVLSAVRKYPVELLLEVVGEQLTHGKGKGKGCKGKGKAAGEGKGRGKANGAVAGGGAGADAAEAHGDVGEDARVDAGEVLGDVSAGGGSAAGGL